MEKKENYSGLAERQALINDYEGRGFRMLHDNFNPECKDFSNPFGTLIFTDEPEETISSIPSRDLAVELDDLKAELKAKGIIV